MTKMAPIDTILKRLDEAYPKATCALNYHSPLQLLIATILSAQCTDERVNKVTPGLFEKYRTAKDFAEAEPEVLQEAIRSTGFYKNKAKSIRACCRKIVEDYGGKVPESLDEMVKLPGVGRKTANLVLGEVHHIPGIVVDTHVRRLSKRLGLTSQDDPEKIEQDLMRLIQKERWTLFSHQLIHHGRQVCKAKAPLCSQCVLKDVCPSFKGPAS
jgi:endonuclease-3